MNPQNALPLTAAIHYRTITVNGLEIFYREAGPPDAPAVLLLHGFPTSSHMFRDLIPLLAERYRVVAPDYPGFGYSAAPSVADFAYTFDHLAEVMAHFAEGIGLERSALYMQDFGGPVGFRLAVRHPERITALIVQNANAYEEGVTQALRDVVLRVWTDKSPEAVAALRTLFELPQTQRQFLEGADDPTLVSPDSWQHAQWGLERPGNKDIQYVLHADYGSNVERYDRMAPLLPRASAPGARRLGQERLRLRGSRRSGVPPGPEYDRGPSARGGTLRPGDESPRDRGLYPPFSEHACAFLNTHVQASPEKR